MKLSNNTALSLCLGFVLGTGTYSIARAQAPDKPPLEQVEAMVHLNETGLISISYLDPWFWEVGYYAVSLWGFMNESLSAAGVECRELSSALTDNPDQRLGDRSRRILDSQLENGRVKDIRLLSSVLKKYSRKNTIDAENASDKGDYRPLSGDICSNLDPDDPGYLQQMFFAPQNNPEAYFATKCDLIGKMAACLNELNVIDKLNRHRQGDGKYTGVDFSRKLFSVVSGQHAPDLD